MVSQSERTEAELTVEEQDELERQRLVAAALARGDHEMAEFYRTVEFEDPTPEEAEAIERYFEDQANGAKSPEPMTLEEFMAEWREEDPEFVALLERCDERFPGWGDLKYRLPEDHPADFQMLRMLDEHEPEAADFLRGIHDELRSL